MSLGFDILLETLVSSPARRMGIHIAAGRGSGKSRLMGRIIAFLDFLQGVPTVVLDPHGGTIDNFIDRMMYLPRKYQEQFWKRVLYVDMSGHWDYVVPFPFYYRLGSESWFDHSQRYLDVVYKLDSFLQTASIQGWNPLWLTGTVTGMVLSALNLQITEAEELLNNPGSWNNRLLKVRENHPDLAPAVSFLTRLPEMRATEQDRLTSSFFNKIALFSFDPVVKAIVGAAKPGIDWDEVIGQRKIVLLDFRHIKDRVRRQFFLEWALHYFLEYVRHRGPGRQMPISLVVDELAALYSVQGMAPQLFEAELDDLINVISRQYSLWLTVCHQEHFQLPENVNKSLLSLGTQIFGVTMDREAAKALAEYFYRYDPHLVKKVEPVWMSVFMAPRVIDHRTEEFNIEEQILLNSYRFTDLRRFEFLISPAVEEGTRGTSLIKMSIENFDRGLYPEKGTIEAARHKLTRRVGRPVPEVLDEIEKRKIQPRLIEKKTKPSHEVATAEIIQKRSR